MSPAAFAQAQLDRYNAHDLAGFIALYTDDVEIFDFPNTPRISGKAAMQDRYAQILYAGSKVHAVVTQRIVQGNIVIDHETVTNHPLSGDCQLVVMYQIENGGIRRVWAMR